MKNKKFLLTSALPVALSLLIGIPIITVTNDFILKSKASSIVAAEKKDYSSEIKSLESEKKALEAKSEEYDTALKENTAHLEEIEALKSSLEAYTSDLQKATETIAGLDKSIADKQAYLGSLSDLQTAAETETVKLKSGDYKCPSDLKEGRYTAEGSGKLYFYTIANTLKDIVDLSVTDSHSYTFDIVSGESIKAESEITLTRLEF